MSFADAFEQIFKASSKSLLPIVSCGLWPLFRWGSFTFYLIVVSTINRCTFLWNVWVSVSVHTCKCVLFIRAPVRVDVCSYFFTCALAVRGYGESSSRLKTRLSCPPLTVAVSFRPSSSSFLFFFFRFSLFQFGFEI